MHWTSSGLEGKGSRMRGGYKRMGADGVGPQGSDTCSGQKEPGAHRLCAGAKSGGTESCPSGPLECPAVSATGSQLHSPPHNPQDAHRKSTPFSGRGPSRAGLRLCLPSHSQHLKSHQQNQELYSKTCKLLGLLLKRQS